MRLITWNVNKRKAVPEQVAALDTYQPDIIALQEVSEKNLLRFREAFATIGLNFMVDSSAGAPGSRRGYVVVASRWRLHNISPEKEALPCSEATVSVQIELPDARLELHNVHAPSLGVNGALKMDVLEEVYARLACPCSSHRVLCGDFNAPQRETPDGYLMTFAQRDRADGSIGVVRGQDRQDKAERDIFRGLQAFDLSDVYRQLHGFDAQDSSWYAKNRGRTFGFRLDHIFASQSLKPQTCHYLHDLREDNHSDHSGMLSSFAPDSSTPTPE
jgi:exonuclease III